MLIPIVQIEGEKANFFNSMLPELVLVATGYFEAKVSKQKGKSQRSFLFFKEIILNDIISRRV